LLCLVARDSRLGSSPPLAETVTEALGIPPSGSRLRRSPRVPPSLGLLHIGTAAKAAPTDKFPRVVRAAEVGASRATPSSSHSLISNSANSGAQLLARGGIIASGHTAHTAVADLKPLDDGETERAGVLNDTTTH
jgi:hypothetical protein